MTTFDLYGSSALDAERLCARLAEVLSVGFTRHESAFRGVYFGAGAVGGERFEVQPNQVPGDDGGTEPMEPEFADVPVLLYVMASPDPDGRRRSLAAVSGLEFLRRQWT